MINLEKLLNIKIDKFYCISLEERKDRREFLKTQFSKLDHKITYHIVQRNKDPVRGCLESHIECIKEAKELGYENILMLEDDILINEKMIEDFKSIHIPEDFDMFYLGYHVNDGLNYGSNILKLLSAQTTHAYIINKRIFDYVLENIEQNWNKLNEWNIRNKYESRTNYNVKAIDLFYSKWVHHHRQKTYGIYPIFIHQKPDYSDIEKRNIDYRGLMNIKADEFNKIKPYEYKTWVLNLERRRDRWVKMEKLFKENELDAYKIKAIDGSVFNFEKYNDLFSLRDFKLRTKNPYHHHQYNRGVLGCALSHYKMWESIKNNKELNNEDYILIIEDDCYFIDNFETHLNLLLDELKYKMWDICFIGYTDYVPLDDDKKDGNNLIKMSGSKRERGGGTFGYFITKAGAKKYYDIANDRNIQQAVDWFMIEQYDKVNAYKTINDLVFSNVAGVQGHDSDVQNVSRSGLNSVDTFFDIEIKNFKFKDNMLLKDQYNNIFQFEDPFKFQYFGNLVEEKRIEIKKFHKYMSKTRLKKNNDYVVIFAGSKMKMFIHFLAKYITKTYNKNIIVFYNDFDFKLDNIQYIDSQKFDKLNKILRFKTVFVLDLGMFLGNYIEKWNDIILLEDGEFFNSTKFDNILLPDYGNYLLKNILHKVDNIYGISETTLHYFKIKTGITDKLPLIYPAFSSTDIFEEDEVDKLKINEDDVLLISYDFDVKTIIKFYHTLDIPNKKMLLFSDVFKSVDDNIIIKPRLFKTNVSYINQASFYLTQSKSADDYYYTHIALSKGIICVIPEYYKELNNKTITFKTSLMETKDKVESCIKTPTKKDIYNKIAKSYYYNINSKLNNFKLFT